MTQNHHPVAKGFEFNTIWKPSPVLGEGGPRQWWVRDCCKWKTYKNSLIRLSATISLREKAKNVLTSFPPNPASMHSLIPLWSGSNCRGSMICVCWNVSDRWNFENAFLLFPPNQQLPFLPKLSFAWYSATFFPPLYSKSGSSTLDMKQPFT